MVKLRGDASVIAASVQQTTTFDTLFERLGVFLIEDVQPGAWIASRINDLVCVWVAFCETVRGLGSLETARDPLQLDRA
jgi:hypothetical protein